MRSERQFSIPISAVEAIHRAKYLLGKTKYRCSQTPEGLRCERAYFGSGFVAIRPHHVHALVNISLRDSMNGSCEVAVEQKIMKLGQPSSNLDKMVWKGEIDDLEAYLTRNEEPRIDRIEQDVYAGKVTLKYVLAVVLPLSGVLIYFLATMNYVGGAIALVLFLLTVVMLPFLPFKMPEFPLENQVPAPPFVSNYLRGRD